MERLGVWIVGSNGAVATTLVAGVELMVRGKAPRFGIVTESPAYERFDLARLEDLVFGGWDCCGGNAYEAAHRHGVLPAALLAEARPALEQMVPRPAVIATAHRRPEQDHYMVAKGMRAQIAQLVADLDAFRREHRLNRVVMVNLSSTEPYHCVEDVHLSLQAFEAGLDADDPRISPAMMYLYAACQLGIPHCNFTPSLCAIPALEALAAAKGVPIAGEDGKTGQTLLKTALAPAFVVRGLKVDGWYSTNILGNDDGRVLDDPRANKTKVQSKAACLDDILGYPVPAHRIQIDYYRPRGDAKEAWDSIDLVGFLGQRMQLKINFLCRDSILAAPLVLDIARLLDLAKRHRAGGIQRQLSLFFKAPYHAQGERPVHDLFQQQRLLDEWLAALPDLFSIATGAV